DEDQPSHLHVLDTEICATRCAEEYGNPCQRFCPAAVYEMEQNPETGRHELKVNFSNCVHCKPCDIADPYQIINWVPPEGGGGPNYEGMCVLALWECSIHAKFRLRSDVNLAICDGGDGKPDCGTRSIGALNRTIVEVSPHI